MTEPANPGYSKYGFDTEFFELDVAGGGFRVAQGRGDALENARAEGYARGLAEGKAAATAEMAEMAKRFTTLAEQLTQAQKNWEDKTLRQMLTLWYGSLNSMFGQAAQHYPEAILEQHLKQLLPLVKSGEELTLRINPAARGFHEKLGLAHAHISGHNFRIVDDHSLPATDCVAEWRGGGLEAKVNDHQKLIAELLTSAGATVEAPPPAVASANTPAPAAGEPAQKAGAQAKSRADELLGNEELVDALK